MSGAEAPSVTWQRGVRHSGRGFRTFLMPSERVGTFKKHANVCKMIRNVYFFSHNVWTITNHLYKETGLHSSKHFLSDFEHSLLS